MAPEDICFSPFSLPLLAPPPSLVSLIPVLLWTDTSLRGKISLCSRPAAPLWAGSGVGAGFWRANIRLREGFSSFPDSSSSCNCPSLDVQGHTGSSVLGGLLRCSHLRGTAVLGGTCATAAAVSALRGASSFGQTHIEYVAKNSKTGDRTVRNWYPLCLLTKHMEYRLPSSSSAHRDSQGQALPSCGSLAPSPTWAPSCGPGPPGAVGTSCDWLPALSLCQLSV